ncbi:hypothetical protein BV20DRAFT_613573 [Pilatotrama ljubarskyi]|nr:hypothetical protein BV20DRAFT_613573 [Pilatotrama ljubarskyi]
MHGLIGQCGPPEAPVQHQQHEVASPVGARPREPPATSDSATQRRRRGRSCYQPCPGPGLLQIAMAKAGACQLHTILAAATASPARAHAPCSPHRGTPLPRASRNPCHRRRASPPEPVALYQRPVGRNARARVCMYGGGLHSSRTYPRPG